MRKIGCIIALVCALAGSCQSPHTENLVKEWLDKEIVFPDSSTFTIYGEKSVDFTVLDSNYKILTYIDSIGCSSCKLQLSKWKEFMSEIDSVSDKNVSFLFFLHPNNVREVKIKLKEERFKYPVCFDYKDELNKKNKLLHDINFQTFLLDSTNKVKLIGNPIYSNKIRQLYLNHLRNGKVSNKFSEKYTHVVLLNEQRINLGTFDWEEKKDTCVKLINKGPLPLIVYEVTTSCECTSAMPSLKEIKVNDTLQISVSYKAEHPGPFERNILIHCNIEEEPIEIILEGETI